MLRVIRVAERGVMEILGLVEPDSPNPRRNTSKNSFEVLQNGNREATRCRLVAVSLPLCCRFHSRSAGKRQQSGNMLPAQNQLSSNKA